MGIIVYDLALTVLRADGIVPKDNKNTFGFLARLEPYVEVRLCPKGINTPEEKKIFVGKTATALRTPTLEWEPVPLKVQLPAARFTNEAMFELTLRNSQDYTLMKDFTLIKDFTLMKDFNLKNTEIKDETIGIVPVLIPLHNLGSTTTKWYEMPERTERVQCILSTKRAIQKGLGPYSEKLSSDQLSVLTSLNSKSTRAITKTVAPSKTDIRAIELIINKGTGLVAKDHNLIGKATTSDPYVEVRFCPDGPAQSNATKIFVGKTPTQWKTLEPCWEYSLSTLQPKKKLSQFATFELTVMDWDDGEDDDLMGIIHIPIGRSGSTTKWYDIPASSAQGASGKLNCTLTVVKITELGGSEHNTTASMARPSYRTPAKLTAESESMDISSSNNKSSLKPVSSAPQIIALWSKKELVRHRLPPRDAGKKANLAILFGADCAKIDKYCKEDRRSRENREQRSPKISARFMTHSARDIIGEGENQEKSPRSRPGLNSTIEFRERLRSKSANGLFGQKERERPAPAGTLRRQAMGKDGSSRGVDRKSPKPRIVKDLSRLNLGSDSDPDLVPSVSSKSRKSPSRRGRGASQSRHLDANSNYKRAGSVSKSSSTGDLTKAKQMRRVKDSVDNFVRLGEGKERSRSKGLLSPKSARGRTTKKSTVEVLQVDARQQPDTKISTLLKDVEDFTKPSSGSDQARKRSSSAIRLVKLAVQTKDTAEEKPRAMKSTSLRKLDVGGDIPNKERRRVARSSSNRGLG